MSVSQGSLRASQTVQVKTDPGAGEGGGGAQGQTFFGSWRSLLEKLSSTSRGRPADLTRPLRDVGVIEARLLPRWDKAPPMIEAEPGRLQAEAHAALRPDKVALMQLCQTRL